MRYSQAMRWRLKRTMTDKPVTKSAAASSPAPRNSSSAEPEHAHFVKRDVMPIWLLVTIFFAVLILTWVLMLPTWREELNQYLARKAQREQRYEDAIEPLLFLINKPSKKPEDPQTVGSKNPTYLSELAHSYLQIKDYDNALKYYRLAQENRFTFARDDQGEAREAPNFSRDIGRVLLLQGKLDEAEQHISQYLAKNKIDKLGNFLMGELEMKRGNYVKAADYFKVVASDPDYQEQVQKYYAEIENKLFAGIE